MNGECGDMVWNEIVSAVCVCLSATIFSISLLNNIKKNILFIQIFSSILYISSYVIMIPILDTAVMGSIVAIAEVIRLIVFFFITNSESFNTMNINIITGVSFAILISVATIYAWAGWYCVFPLIGGIMVSLALGCKSVMWIKLSYIFQTFCVILYLAFMHLWINMGSQIVVIIMGVVGLFGFILKKRKDEASKQQIE